MLGASLPSTSWEPPVLFKVLFLGLEWQVRLQPKAISHLLPVFSPSLSVDRSDIWPSCNCSLLTRHPRNQYHSKFRQSIATKKVESLLKQWKKKNGNSIYATITHRYRFRFFIPNTKNETRSCKKRLQKGYSTASGLKCGRRYHWLFSITYEQLWICMQWCEDDIITFLINRLLSWVDPGAPNSSY